MDSYDTNYGRSNPALRGIGPKTFVSYSFKDRISAEQLAAYLISRGFQVRKEDETSLVGRRLAEELPHRISDAECFIQLLTEDSTRSQWIKEEFKYAEQCAKTKNLTIIPVLLHGSGDHLGDFAYVDARREGLSPSILEGINAIALNCIRVVSIEDANPFQVSRTDVVKIFASSNLKKRIIFDSTGYWFRFIDSLIAWADSPSKNDMEGKDQFIQQELETKRTQGWILEIFDVVLNSLVEEIHECYARGIVEEKHKGLIVDLFYNIVLTKHLFDTLRMGMRSHIVEIGRAAQDEMRALEEIAQEGGAGSQGFGFFLEQSKLDKGITQAFRRVFRNSDLAEYSCERKPPLILWMVLAHAKRAAAQMTTPGIYVHFPKQAAPYILGQELLPHPTAKEWCWALFGLPQIAVYALELGGRCRGSLKENMVQTIKTGVGWKLQDYERITISSEVGY